MNVDFVVVLGNPSAKWVMWSEQMKNGDEEHAGTILLVQDEAFVRESRGRFCNRQDSGFGAPKNSAEARQVLDGIGDKIDLLLTDIILPGGARHGGEDARRDLEISELQQDRRAQRYVVADMDPVSKRHTHRDESEPYRPIP